MVHDYRKIHGCLLLLSLLLGGNASADVPRDGWIVWASNRQDSRHEIYLMRADGSGLKRLTFDGGTRPAWSPDGRWIAYTAPDDSARVVRNDGSDDKKVCDEIFRFWMWDNSGMVCGWNTYTLVDPRTNKAAPFFKQSDFLHLVDSKFAPSGITHDGRWVVGWSSRYANAFTGSNGTYKEQNTAVVLDRQDTSKIYFFGGGCEPTTSPTGNMLYHVCGTRDVCNDKPDIYRMSIDDITKEPQVDPSTGLNDVKKRPWYEPEVSHEEADWGHEYFPRVSNDNEWIIYGASTGCHDHDICDYEVFVHRRGADSSSRTRITHDPKNDQWPHLWVGVLPDGDQPIEPSPRPSSEDDQHGSSGCTTAGHPSNDVLLMLLILALAAGTTRTGSRRND